jgi:3-hydroxybutyryl-CoA dehydrogenase
MTRAEISESAAPTVGIVGAGQMGRGIAQVAAVAGLPVRLYDSREGAAREAQDFIRRMLGRAADKGRMTQDQVSGAMDRLRVVDDLGAFAGCGVVIEAIVEDLEAKRRLFAGLEDIVGDGCILATNTSSLSVTAIAAACRYPGRCAGFHFFNPVPLMKIVEVVDGLRSDPVVGDALAALARRFGHRPVRVKDTPGFLVNHAGRAYGTEALRILGEGVAEPVEVDRVMREAAGFPMGPFELLDLTGLDVSDPVMRSIYHQFYEEPRLRPSPVTATRVAAGLLGRKTGQGFYRYAEGRKQEPAETPRPARRPDRVWVSPAEPEAQKAILAALTPLGIAVSATGAPAPDALCIVTPFGQDATTTALAEGLDPARTLAVDTLLGLDRRITLMATPLTTAANREAAHGLFGATGRPVTLIADSPGFIAQRILACIVNVASEIAQQRIATPDDIDDAVRLGLGYPAGPLELGDKLGLDRILRILERMQQATGDPRYRPSLWLRRRAQLGVSLKTPDLAP